MFILCGNPSFLLDIKLFIFKRRLGYVSRLKSLEKRFSERKEKF